MSGPVALLTGCAGGIGGCVAKDLVTKGFCLMLTDLSRDDLLQRFSESEHLTTASLDVRDEARWQEITDQTLQQFGRLDYLFNIAGYLKPGTVVDSDAGEMRKHLEINTLGAMIGTRTAAGIMVEQGSGHIINIASLAGVAPIPGISSYSASKFALRGFSLAAAQELRRSGVFVTVVCPDAVATPMLDLQVDYDEAALTFSGSQRFLTPEQISTIILKRVMTRKPMEVQIPLGRGLLARLASAFPWVSRIVGGSLEKKGLKRLARIRFENRNSGS